MNYLSTRGEAPILGFEDVLLAGLASDGGLYVPEEFARFGPGEIAALRGRSYQELAFCVMRPYLGAAPDDAAFRAMIAEACAGFRHPAVTPLVQTGCDEWILELHHGPTLAFKDIAMQLVARLMDHALERRRARATVICATSGDTGGAAVAAFAGRARADLFVLLPKGRVSDVQRRMMTTSGAENIHVLEVDGTFDDCQALVKAMFNDPEFRAEMALSGVNSINWARVMAQTVYYFAAALALGAPDRPVSFAVPTGNFGDILAGYVAKRMGLSIDRLVIATNVNDILARTLESGTYQIAAVAGTSSPSMDIQVSSNFERLLFELTRRDDAAVRGLMGRLDQSGGYQLDGAVLDRLRAEFDAGSADEDETLATIRTIFEETGMLIDPHTAVAMSVARRRPRGASPMVVLATAHAAKFPGTVEKATGRAPALPGHVGDLHQRREALVPLANDLSAVMRAIRMRAAAPTGAGA
jgi:threonine synthase